MSAGVVALVIAWALIVALGLGVIVGTFLNRANRIRRAEDDAALARAVADAKQLPEQLHDRRVAQAYRDAGEPWMGDDQMHWEEVVRRAGFPPPVGGPGDDWGQRSRHPQA